MEKVAPNLIQEGYGAAPQKAAHQSTQYQHGEEDAAGSAAAEGHHGEDEFYSQK